MTPNEAYLQEQLDRTNALMEQAIAAFRAGETTIRTLSAYSATQAEIIELFSLQVEALMSAVVDYRERCGETAAARHAIITVAGIKQQMEVRLAAGRNEVARLRLVAYKQQQE